MAKPGWFSTDPRAKKRKTFSNILETFTQVQEDLTEFISEKDGHVARIDREMTELAMEKKTAEAEQEKARTISGNLATFLGENG